MKKNFIKLLLCGVAVITIPEYLAQAQQQVSNTQVAAMVEALRLAAPQSVGAIVDITAIGKLNQKLSKAGQKLV